MDIFAFGIIQPVFVANCLSCMLKKFVIIYVFYCSRIYISQKSFLPKPLGIVMISLNILLILCYCLVLTKATQKERKKVSVASFFVPITVKDMFMSFSAPNEK